MFTAQLEATIELDDFSKRRHLNCLNSRLNSLVANHGSMFMPEELDTKLSPTCQSQNQEDGRGNQTHLTQKVVCAAHTAVLPPSEQQDHLKDIKRQLAYLNKRGASILLDQRLHLNDHGV